MAKEVVKKNQSSMQVIKTLLVLLEDNYTMQELVQKLNEKEEEPIFNNSVVSKYINTCRYCGIDIIKVHNKYFVRSMPFGMEILYHMRKQKSKQYMKKDLQFSQVLFGGDGGDLPAD